MSTTTSVRSVRDDAKLAGIFGTASAFAAALLVPYMQQAMPAAFESVKLPLAMIALLQGLQAGVLLTLLSFLGLRMAPCCGLGAPWFSASKRIEQRPALPWGLAIGMGAASGVAIIALALLFDPHLPPRLHAATSPPAMNALTGFMAAFYGGIAEEIVFRLFLMTLIVWLVAKLGKRTPGHLVFWGAILMSAFLFGASHLPAATLVWPLNEAVVSYTISLNLVAGLVFGWLYWRHGIETAMLAHFSADIVLHVLAPLAGAALA